MKIRAELPPGVNALLFESARRRRRLEARLCRRLEAEGFTEVLLPILDYFDPYQPLLSESARERLYRFVDRDGQLLALRGDFTPMLARLIAPRLSAVELPRGLYYRGDVVRYQELRPGRMREYSELGCELLDEPCRENDERVLGLFVELLAAALGREDPGRREEPLAGSDGDPTQGLRIVVGRAGALDELVRDLGGDGDTLQAVLRRDRGAVRRCGEVLVQILEEGRPRELVALGAAGDEVAKLVDLCSRLESRFASSGARISVDLAEFAAFSLDPELAVQASRSRAPDSSPAQFRPAQAPAHGYYDGVVFKAYLAGESQPVGRGGRYDGLFRALGADVSATGFSIGLDRLLPFADGFPDENANGEADQEPEGAAGAEGSRRRSEIAP